MYITFIAVLAFTAFSVDAAGCKNSVGISKREARTVRNKFKAANITGSIIQSFKPIVDVSVTYEDGSAANYGNVVKTTSTLLEPTVAFTREPGSNPRTTNYTILMFDPDAPSPDTPLLRSFLHVIKYNVHPSCAPNTAADEQTQAMYMAPTPLSLPAHRYIFLILRQPKRTFTPPVQVPATIARGMFDVPAFLEEGKFTIVGGNFFTQGLVSNLP